jgi:hypothetical protein
VARVVTGIVVIASGVALLAMPAGAERQGTAVASCGDLPSGLVYKITARRVSCRIARRVARQWGSQCAQIPTGSCLTTSHFYCRYSDTRYEAGAIRCVHEADLRKAMTAQRAVRFITSS